MVLDIFRFILQMSGEQNLKIHQIILNYKSMDMHNNESMDIKGYEPIIIEDYEPVNINDISSDVQNNGSNRPMVIQNYDKNNQDIYSKYKLLEEKYRLGPDGQLINKLIVQDDRPFSNLLSISKDVDPKKR
jgi:hypothetical protein